MSGAFGSVHLPDWAWRSAAARTALQHRDAAAILRLAQQHTGASQHRLANAVDILQGRLSEILRGARTVTALEVYQRIADGLTMPDHARLTLGLAPHRPAGQAEPALDLGEVPDTFPNQAQASADIRATARDATHIRVLAVRGLGPVGLKDSLLGETVKRDTQPPTVTILLTDPEAASTATRAAEVGEPAESFSGGIRLCLARLAELRRDGLAVHLYDALPVWRAHVTGPRDPEVDSYHECSPSTARRSVFRFRLVSLWGGRVRHRLLASADVSCGYEVIDVSSPVTVATVSPLPSAAASPGAV